MEHIGMYPLDTVKTHMQAEVRKVIVFSDRCPNYIPNPNMCKGRLIPPRSGKGGIEDQCGTGVGPTRGTGEQLVGSCQTASVASCSFEHLSSKHCRVNPLGGRGDYYICDKRFSETCFSECCYLTVTVDVDDSNPWHGHTFLNSSAISGNPVELLGFPFFHASTSCSAGSQHVFESIPGPLAHVPGWLIFYDRFMRRSADAR